jgi:hypothetical protein
MNGFCNGYGAGTLDMKNVTLEDTRAFVMPKIKLTGTLIANGSYFYGPTEWWFDPTPGEIGVRSTSEDCSPCLKFSGEHTFTGGRVAFKGTSLELSPGASIYVENSAAFWLSDGNLIEGNIIARKGGYADMSADYCFGKVGAEDDSKVRLGNTQTFGQVYTKGTGRIIGGNYQGAEINGHIQSGGTTNVKLAGDIRGDFVVHLPEYKRLHFEGDTRFAANTSVEVIFEGSKVNNEILADSYKLTIDNGGKLKITGNQGTARGILLKNDGVVLTHGVNGFHFVTEDDSTNSGTIQFTNNSRAGIGTLNNANGTVSVDETSTGSFGKLIGGLLKGPVNRQRDAGRSERAYSQEGAFVGGGGTLQDVVSDATIVVPEGETLKIADSLTNKGQLVIEGNSEIGTVKLDSQITTFDGGG